jgi:hypothetical protein
MGVNYNPRVVTNGLVLCLDAANANKSAKGFKNLTDLSTWTLGTGGTANYPMVGDVSENQRILDTGPFGYSSIVWDTPSTGVDSDADGGFTGPYINIDPTKLYRFSIWMRRKTVGNGSSYLGCHAWDIVSQQVLNRSNGATNQNPYFLASNYWGNVNDWYLITGHIWPAGSGTGSSKEDSGIYTTAGTKISGTTDYVWQATNTYTYTRSFLYYSTDITTRQQLYQPRIDLVDGTEPTVAELIAGVGSKWYDLAGTNHGNILNSAALYNNAGYMNFDGVDDHVIINQPNIQTSPNRFSIEFVLYPIGTDFILVSPYSAGLDHFIRYDGANQRINFQVTEVADLNNRARLSTTNSVPLNAYTHIVCTMDNLDLKIYINGILNSSFTETIVIANWDNLWHIGQRANDTFRFNGRLPLIKVYNRELSALEISQNFNAARRRFGV